MLVLNFILLIIVPWIIYIAFSFNRIFRIMEECGVDMNTAKEFYKSEILK